MPLYNWRMKVEKCQWASKSTLDNAGCYCPIDKCMAPIIMGRQVKCLRGPSPKVADLSSHMALQCSCGSCKVVLLKSGKVECAKCSLQIDANWSLE